MAVKCEFCNKKVTIGRQHTHHPGVAGGRWKKRAPKTQKIIKPNLHVTHIVVDGMRKKVKLCTKCLRRAKSSLMKKTKPNLKEETNKNKMKIVTSSINTATI